MAASELHKQKRSRNLAVAFALLALVVLLFCVSLVKLSSG